jgi:hypothetical protein
MNSPGTEPEPHHQGQRLAESKVLEALLFCRLSGEERAAELRRLMNYDWIEGEHRVVYEAMVGCGILEAKEMQARLPEIATRLGFPEIEWSKYFSGEESLRQAAKDLDQGIQILLKREKTAEK